MKQNFDQIIKNYQPIFLDTCCFIYTIEENPDYIEITKQILNLITDKKIQAVTSVVTLGEVLRKPIEHNNLILAKIYKSVITQTENLRTLPIDIDTSILASKIASDYNINLLDAFQLAASKKADCKAFITNDKQLKKVKEIKVVLLEELVK